MKKLVFALVFGILTLGLVSFTIYEVYAHKTSGGYVEFKITNNTSSEFKYCVNGGHNYISSGSTKSFSYADGQTFYYVEGSNCGSLWFKVTTSMNGHEYKVTDF